MTLVQSMVNENALWVTKKICRGQIPVLAVGRTLLIVFPRKEHMGSYLNLAKSTLRQATLLGTNE